MYVDSYAYLMLTLLSLLRFTLLLSLPSLLRGVCPAQLRGANYGTMRAGKRRELLSEYLTFPRTRRVGLRSVCMRWYLLVPPGVTFW